jgi:prepilin-type processing-associated H-X9-DG protein
VGHNAQERPESFAGRGSAFAGGYRGANTLPGSYAINCNNAEDIHGFHPGGANALFTDGSVHFLNAGLNINLVVALMTRAGGEVTPGDTF